MSGLMTPGPEDTLLMCLKTSFLGLGVRKALEDLMSSFLSHGPEGSVVLWKSDPVAYLTGGDPDSSVFLLCYMNKTKE